MNPVDQIKQPESDPSVGARSLATIRATWNRSGDLIFRGGRSLIDGLWMIGLGIFLAVGGTLAAILYFPAKAVFKKRDLFGDSQAMKDDRSPPVGDSRKDM